MKNNLLLILFTVVTALYGCKSHKQSGKNIFRYNETTGIATLDPAFARNQSIMWAVHQLYNTLTEVDDSLGIKPMLAKSWDYSDGQKTLVFHLRTDVYFHNDPVFENAKGRRLTAYDVQYSFERLMNPATASPGAWIFNNRVAALQPFTAVNDSTFILKLAKPFPPILGILSMQYCSIVAKEAVEHYGSAFRRHPVGTGPFQFVAWDEGQALILKKNNHYFEIDVDGNALPYLDGIKISFLDSKASEFMEFRQKRLDFINDIEASFKDEVITKTGNLKEQWKGKIVLQKHPYLNVEYLGILMDSSNSLMYTSALRFKKVRQAINYSINRPKMMLYMRNSIGTAAQNGFVPPGLPFESSNKVRGYSYNPDTAKTLLKEADYKGEKIVLHTIPIYSSIAGFIANELQQNGINVVVETVQKSLLFDLTAKGRSAFFRASWIADYPDAENFLSVFYGKNPAPPNYTRYKNPKFDALYENAMQQTDDKKRYALYREMDQLVMDAAPVVPLWYDMALHLVQPGVKNFFPNSLNMLELRKVKK